MCIRASQWTFTVVSWPGSQDNRRWLFLIISKIPVLTCRDQNRLRKMAVGHSEPSITVTAPNLFRKEPLQSVLHVSSCRGAIFQAKFRGSPLCGSWPRCCCRFQPMVRCQPLSDLDSMAALLSSQNKFANLKSIWVRDWGCRPVHTNDTLSSAVVCRYFVHLG